MQVACGTLAEIWATNRYTDAVWFHSHNLGHFGSNQIDRDALANLDNLVNVENCKRARQTLLWPCNAGFGDFDNIFSATVERGDCP